MKRYLKLALFPLGLFVILASLIWVPSLRVSLPEMKSRAALNLDFGSSRAQVNAFLRGQHMRMEATTYQETAANGADITVSKVRLRPFLAKPIYFKFDFAGDKLLDWAIADAPNILGADVAG